MEMGARMLNKDGENTESPNGKTFKSEKFPLSWWEFVVALGVFLVFLTGLFCIYLTMPATAYGELRLPRTLFELRVIKLVTAESRQMPSVEDLICRVGRIHFAMPKLPAPWRRMVGMVGFDLSAMVGMKELWAAEMVVKGLFPLFH
ncbi:unnamed protein product [Fraxinus pennsylvanica]|uniref:Uncharacterized protein n=1 Tax=Fraxinus pennsylvanica TaxID=56036 RepID=A0AAD2ECP2_9LAMI|nr:unnamed protein product [Fraxinus pennsylvanica]